MATKTSAARGAHITASTKSANASITKIEPQEVTPFSQALSRLEPLQVVLKGLAHRNHNQHRRAAWWRSFGMLRRNCAKLAENLVVAEAVARKSAARAARAAAKAKSKKRRREETATNEDGPLDVQLSEPETRVVVDHAVWFQEVLAPKCYLAFSQLTADNQFAPLGVVLLGVLAQIKAACELLAPMPASNLMSSPSTGDIAATEPKVSMTRKPTEISQGVDSSAVVSLDSRLATRQAQAVSDESEEKLREVGGGKSISREDVERAFEQRKRGKETKKANSERKPQSTTTTGHAKAGSPVKRTKSASSKETARLTPVDGVDENIRPTKKMKTAVARKEKVGRESTSIEKKKKKKKTKGDEMDDLFSSLF
ncbi:hypothetical protein F4808DRAFT_440800 [Astrocystis sublimbata]|nr:hypothetical protein F4808DRAFT_440800 [Astrocystis sublimbata]